MKLKEYLEEINKLIKENPHILEYELVCSSDDEGNDFNPVYYGPTIGTYDEHKWGYERFTADNPVTNAICLN